MNANGRNLKKKIKRKEKPRWEEKTYGTFSHHNHMDVPD